ncbi:MAG: helix-turn-helix domain-containing protein [Fibrobacteria bacterium]|nr:helix-turn-helix domain-containing protein [Fibrobacteria bacterium]
MSELLKHCHEAAQYFYAHGYVHSIMPELPLWIEMMGLVHSDPEHYYADNRDQWVLHICIKGSGFVKTKGITTPVKSPSLLILEPHIYHEHWANPDDPWTLFHWFLRKDDGLNTKTLKELGLIKEVIQLFNNSNPGKKEIDTFLKPISSALKKIITANEESPLYTYKHYLTMFEFHLALSQCSRQKLQYPSNKNLIERAERIMLNLADISFDANSLAERLGVSRSTLTRTFKNAGFPPPGELITQRKMQHARNLLKNIKDINLKHLARACGYPDPAHFCRAFGSFHGVSPMKFLKKNGIEVKADVNQQTTIFS